MTNTQPTVVVCGSADTKGLNVKEGYAPSIAPSPFKRHGGSKILLLIKVKYFRQIPENFAKSKKTSMFVVQLKNKSFIIITKKNI